MGIGMTRYRLHTRDTGGLSFQLCITPETAVCGRCGHHFWRWLCTLCTNIHTRRTGTAVVLVRAWPSWCCRATCTEYVEVLGRRWKERWLLGCWILGTFGKFGRILNIIPWLVLDFGNFWKILLKVEKRQLWVQPFEWLKLNFASCVVHQTRSYNIIFVN